MSNNFTYILILILIIVFVIVLWIVLWRQKTQSLKFDKQMTDIKANYEHEIVYLKSEINRQKYILVNYQKQLGNIDSDNSTVFNFKTDQATENIIFDLTSDKEKLEDEKNKFQEKNKKLWELSIAVHKEKERIDKKKKQIEYDHKQVTESILYAKTIQTALLPAKETIDKCLKEYFIYWRPRDIVSGDFYWLKDLPDQMIFAVADCTGHGVPGAFMSALGISFLNEIISHEKVIQSNLILEEMRRMVKSSLHQTGIDSESKDGMDMAVCVVNKKTNNLTFSGANNPLILYRAGELIEYAATRNPVGVFIRESDFTSYEIDLQPDDIFYLFSDGFADEFGGDRGRKFSKSSFKQLLLELNLNKLSLTGQGKKIDETMKNWLGETYHQIDDMLVVGFKVN